MICQAYNLSPKVTLEGFSRGVIMGIQLGYKKSSKIACIYVDAPVCDIFSWPGRERKDLLEQDAGRMESEGRRYGGF